MSDKPQGKKVEGLLTRAFRELQERCERERAGLEKRIKAEALARMQEDVEASRAGPFGNNPGAPFAGKSELPSGNAPTMADQTGPDHPRGDEIRRQVSSLGISSLNI
jgi:hypothetical protein